MIVEVHLTMLEEAANDEHVEACQDPACEHQAHLFKTVANGYAGSAQVFEFVTESKGDYEKRLRRNKMRRDQEAPFATLRKQEARSLSAIRRGWNRLYGVDEA